MSEATGGTRWVHRPARGPLAWGVAVLATPTTPLMALLAMFLLTPVTGSWAAFRLAPVAVLVVGALIVALARPSRAVRGLGVGMVAGAVALLPLVVLAGSGWGR